MAKILIADDDAHTIRVMSLWLERHGHEVLEARDGAVALETLKGSARDEIDLVISDMNMPNVNGIELLRTTREEVGMDVPFLMLSSRCDQADIRQQIEPYGACLYPKPFVPSQLVERIDLLLGLAAT